MVGKGRSVEVLFGGVSTRDYGALLTDSSYEGGPERDCTSVEVAGRNGDIVIDNGRYKNVEVTARLFFWDRGQMEAYRGRLLSMPGYRRLEFSHCPDEYRVARVKGSFGIELKGMGGKHGEATVTFDCKPQRFLKGGDRAVELTASSTRALHNPYGTVALPLIRVWGAGTLGVGSCTLSIAAHGKPYLDIDSAVQDCLYEAANLNASVTLSSGSFPTLPPGDIGVSLGSGITKVIIYPRWWRL